RGARRWGYYTFSRPAYLCAQIQLGDPRERKALKQSVTKRKHLRYYLRGMEKIGTVKVDHLKSWQCTGSFLSPFRQGHVARFLATRRISNLARTERRLFLTELARLLSAEGWLVISRLMVGSEAIAWNYGFQFAGSWFWYQPTFDTKWQNLSPGFCL